MADEGQDLALALGERLVGRRVSRRVRIRLASRRATCGSRWTSPACARADRDGDVVGIGVLEQVAGGPGLEGGGDLAPPR